MAHQLTLSLKQKQNPHGILMKVKREDSFLNIYVKNLQNKTSVLCCPNKTRMRLNVKQLDCVVVVEFMLPHKKHLETPVEMYSVLV